MIQAFVRAISRIYEVFWMLVVTALLVAATAAMWHFYEQERRQRQFQEQGQPVTVQIERTDRHHRDIWDALGNFVYVGFTYRNHPYETRCGYDSSWVSEGDRMKLLYNPQTDAFGQPQRMVISSPNRVVSRLIDWTIIKGFKRENQLLGGLILAAMALFFCVAGAIASLTGWTFIQRVAGTVFMIGLGASAVFLTYDTIQYYRYFDSLRTNGQPMDVVVLDTDRHIHGRGHKGSGHWYTYDATFRYNGQERVIAIDEADYDRLKSGDTRLRVLHNAAQNDFTAVDYSAGFSQLLLPVFFWFLLFSTMRSTGARPGIAQAGTR